MTIHQFFVHRQNPRFCGYWFSPCDSQPVGASIFIQYVTMAFSSNKLIIVTTKWLSQRSMHNLYLRRYGEIMLPKGWIAASHAGFYNPPQSASYGLAISVTVTSGTKIFGLISPLGGEMDANRWSTFDARARDPAKVYGTRRSYVVLPAGSSMWVPSHTLRGEYGDPF